MLRLNKLACLNKPVHDSLVTGEVKKPQQISRTLDKEFRLRFKSITLFAALNGVSVHVYNGVKFLPIFITNYMVGKPLGMFVLTKRITKEIHRKQTQTRGKKAFTKKK